MTGLFDILIFAAIALVLVFKLSMVLGKKTDGERRQSGFSNLGSEFNKSAEQGPQADDEHHTADVIPLKTLSASPDVPPEALQGVEKIQAADAAFTPQNFLEGAEIAFTTILKAYAEGDRKMLKMLLDRKVYHDFDTAIRAREKAGQRMNIDILDIESLRMTKTGFRGQYVYITVEFTSRQIFALLDADDQVVDGQPEAEVTLIDRWTFRRKLSSSDPNWVLCASQTL